MFTSGQVPAARLDDIVRRTLFAMFDSGAFDDPLGPAADDVSTPEHRDLAARVSEDGMVLLKNEHRALPLGERAPRSIAVIGPSGDDAIYITGGSAGVPPAAGTAITPLAGIAARAGSRVKLNVAQGSLGDAPLPDLVPGSVLKPSSGDGPGLLGSYWSNGDFDGAPALSRVEETVDLSAAPAGLGDVWSARWTGTLTPTETGLHRFTLMQAGLAHLFVDGREIAGGLSRGHAVHRRPELPDVGHGVPARRKAGLDPHRVLEQGQPVRRPGPLPWQPPSGLADRRARSPPRAARTPRS